MKIQVEIPDHVCRELFADEDAMFRFIDAGSKCSEGDLTPEQIVVTAAFFRAMAHIVSQNVRTPANQQHALTAALRRAYNESPTLSCRAKTGSLVPPL